MLSLFAVLSGAAHLSAATIVSANPLNASFSGVFRQGQYHMTSQPAQRIEAKLTDSYSLPDMYARQWTIYAPDAPDTDDQKSVFSTLDVFNRRFTVATWSELSPLNRTLLQARLYDDGSTRGAHLETKVTYSAELYRRVLTPGPPTTPVAPLSMAESSLYTRSSQTIDYTEPVFQSWLSQTGLRRSPGERDLNFGLRVFEAIRARYVYNYDLNQDRRASAICQVTGTDCGGLSQLYVATLRASGIPATALCGRIARTARVDDHGCCHVKSEFYASGVGWVPVELAGAVYDKSAPYSVYFGRSYGDFLTLSVDNDQKLSTGMGTGAQNQRGLQGVRFWVYGAQDSGTKVSSTSSWDVQQLPLYIYGSRLADARN